MKGAEENWRKLLLWCSENVSWTFLPAKFMATTKKLRVATVKAK